MMPFLPPHIYCHFMYEAFDQWTVSVCIIAGSYVNVRTLGSFVVVFLEFECNGILPLMFSFFVFYKI